jgi:hypothetical protein
MAKSWKGDIASATVILPVFACLMKHSVTRTKTCTILLCGGK